MSDELTLLCELARKYETDKGGNHFNGGDNCHNYTPIYHSLFAKDREHIRAVLEIGVAYGSSVRMWKEYFPKAMIVGFDSNAHALVHTEDRILCIPADQGDPKSLLEAIGKLGPNFPLFDIIIDDGSHILDHQITSMKTLLPFLSVGGFYIIEDVANYINGVLNYPEKELYAVVDDGDYTWHTRWAENG